MVVTSANKCVADWLALTVMPPEQSLPGLLLQIVVLSAKEPVNRHTFTVPPVLTLFKKSTKVAFVTSEAWTVEGRVDRLNCSKPTDCTVPLLDTLRVAWAPCGIEELPITYVSVLTGKSTHQAGPASRNIEDTAINFNGFLMGAP
jgi:hypothetical protein